MECFEFEGFITRLNKEDSISKIKIKVLPNHIYSLKKLTETNSKIIEYLIRAYSGVFSDYVKLNLTKLSKTRKSH